jgi:hypothetical protein
MPNLKILMNVSNTRRLASQFDKFFHLFYVYLMEKLNKLRSRGRVVVTLRI